MIDATGSSPEDLEPTGHGQAAGGRIAVTVSGEGRVSDLRLDPRVLRSGPVTDSVGLAEQIAQAVNAALDDFDKQVKQIAGDIAETLASDLDELGTRFEETLEQMATDIARAHRRLEE